MTNQEDLWDWITVHVDDDEVITAIRRFTKQYLADQTAGFLQYIEKEKQEVRKNTGAFKFDFCYDTIIKMYKERFGV